MMDWIRDLLGRKDTASRVLISMQSTGPYAETPRDYEGFAKEGFQKNVIAYRSILSVASSGATVPWVLYRKGGSANSKRAELENHPFLDLIRRPNPMQAQAQFFEAMIAFRLIAGNSYVEAVGPSKNAMKKVTELWTLRPDRMRIVPGKRGFPQAFVYKLNADEVRYPVDQVSLTSPILHWKGFNPNNDWYGMSPIEAVVYGIDSHNAANKWNLSLLQNSARPSGALVAGVTAGNGTGALSEEQFQRLKAQFDEQHTGARNAGRPMILDGGLDWKAFSFSPQQMDWIDSKNTSARDISLAFGVPPMLLGIPGDNTYSNYQEARAALYEDTVLPTMDSIRDEFNHWLLPSFGDGLEADYDRDQIQALAPRRMAIWDKVQAADWLTVNEKRQATGYDEIDDGDVVLVNSTQLPLEDAIADPSSTDPADPAGAPGKAPADSENNADPEDPAEDERDDEAPAPAPKKSLKSVEDAREGKIFNLPSQKAKQREARGQLRLRAGFQRKALRQVQACFEIEGHRVAKACEGLDREHAESAARREIHANRAQWKTVLTKNAQSVMAAFGERVFKSMKSITGPEELKASVSKYEEFLKKWIEEHVGEQIDGIEETTREAVLDAIRDAQAETFDEGEGVQSLSAKLEEIYADFAEGGRSMTIARTETGIAANTALNEAAKSTGIPGLQKEWVSVSDDRTRPDHVEANGQMVDMGEKFQVGGVELDYPNDPNGPANEIINCRCAQVFSRAKQSDDQSEGSGAGEEE